MTSDKQSAAAFIEEIERSLEKEGALEANLQAVLDQVLTQFGCTVGTIHSLDSGAGLLRLRAQRGIPDAIMNQVQVVPVGKGMAGLAAERREPVQVCNLQTDESGVAKPGAKETRMEGAVTVPILVGGTLRGAMGVAKPVAYEFSKAETDLLLRIGSSVGKFFES